MSDDPNGGNAPPAVLTIPIDPPIVWQQGSHSSLTLQEPTSGQKTAAMEHLRNSTNPATVSLYEEHFVALVSGKPVEVVRMLPISTRNKAMAYIEYFLDLGRRTGWT